MRGPNWKHGHTFMDAAGKVYVSPTWGSWRAMRRRAGHKEGYEHVQVALRWQSFENFLADMGERPPGCTLDRINRDGHYEPGNCRWATAKQQAKVGHRRLASRDERGRWAGPYAR